MKKFLLLLLVANCFLFAGCCTTQCAAKWEYKTLITPNDATPLDPPSQGWVSNDETLNAMLKQGWVVAGYGIDQGNSQWFLLKRRVK